MLRTFNCKTSLFNGYTVYRELLIYFLYLITIQTNYKVGKININPKFKVSVSLVYFVHIQQ